MLSQSGDLRKKNQTDWIALQNLWCLERAEEIVREQQWLVYLKEQIRECKLRLTTGTMVVNAGE